MRSIISEVRNGLTFVDYSPVCSILFMAVFYALKFFKSLNMSGLKDFYVRMAGRKEFPVSIFYKSLDSWWRLPIYNYIRIY